MFTPDTIEIVSEQYAEKVLTRRTYVPGQTYRRTTDKTINARKGNPGKAVASADKKTGRGMILMGVLMVVSLLLVGTISLPVMIVLQVCYAILICVGAILAIESNTDQRHQ